jgi:ribosomal protein L16/L10AE
MRLAAHKLPLRTTFVARHERLLHAAAAGGKA